jgi:signal transduction histidine kinase
MLEPRHQRLPAQPPTVNAPPPLAERRASFRRAEDRQAHQERTLLARALDVLAANTSAEARLAGLLRLLARTAGAHRAAVLAEGIERRCAVSVVPGEDPAAAEALATWLDARSARSRADRAASGLAPISLIVGVDSDGSGADSAAKSATTRELAPEDRRVAVPGRRGGDELADRRIPHTGAGNGSGAETPVTEGDGPWYALLPIPAAGHVVLGFEFDRAGAADRLAERLPPQLARHAAVALSLVTEQLATDRELATLRANEAERTRFVSTVAHELRTPLTGLRGYLELIHGDKVDDPAVERDFLERSLGIVSSMADLVGDLLELSRLESGALELEEEPFSMAESVTHVAAGLMPIALECDIRLRTSLPPRLRSATGDRRRVEQILTNLVANALKFTAPGGRVDINARFDGPVAILTVVDDGTGIAGDDRPRIFERFHRLPGHERITGTGLGLPIARDLARRMGGDLEVASVPGSGSAFVLALPGPAAVHSAVVAAALSRALAVEEIGLEERAVLRAMAIAGHGTTSSSAGGASVEARRRSIRLGGADPSAPKPPRLRPAEGV